MSPEGAKRPRLCYDLEIQGKRKFKEEDLVNNAIDKRGQDE